MNKSIMTGNLTRDPDVSTTPNGVSLCKFSIAVNRAYKDPNGEQIVDFFNIIAWRGLADNCGKYLTKGKKVLVEGELQNRSWEDDNGNKRYATDLIANNVEFLSPVNSNQNQGGYSEPPPERGKKTAAQLTPIEDDGLPF